MFDKNKYPGGELDEYGFFHPSRGYWQSLSWPPEDILASYPTGTVQTPLKPGDGFEWNGSEWVESMQ